MEWLAGPGRALAAGLDAGADPLQGIPALRREHPNTPEALLRAAWTLAAVRTRHLDRLGPVVADLVLTEDLAQQATRPQVAAHRARLLADSGVRHVADATCGAGLEALALAGTGLRVTAVDIDPVAAACARVNAVACGRTIGIRCEDARAGRWHRPDVDALLVDPARRNPGAPRAIAGRSPVERDPERWSPPWSWVVEQSRTLTTVAKCAPGIPLSLVPADADIEWVAVGRDVLEASIWFGRGGGRRATVLDLHGSSSTFAGDPRTAPAGVDEGADHLIEVHEAVRRAGLVGALSAALSAPLAAAQSQWLAARAVIDSPFATTWHVIDRVDIAHLRTVLRGTGPATFKSVDIGRASDEVARSVGHRPTKGARGMTIVLLRGLREAMLVEAGER